MDNKLVEKETTLGLAITLISSGMVLIQQSKIVEGLILIISGFGLLILRGHYKKNRWA
jgi:hypothetical protein